jgi:hypothetical protein
MGSGSAIGKSPAIVLGFATICHQPLTGPPEWQREMALARRRKASPELANQKSEELL